MLEASSEKNEHTIILKMSVDEARQLRDHLGVFPVYDAPFVRALWMHAELARILRTFDPPAKKKHWWSL